MKITLLFTLITLFLAKAVYAQTTNFSGNWLLNESRSDFKGQPSALMFQKINVEQTAIQLKVTGTIFNSPAGKTPKMTIYSLDGAKLTSLLNNNRTMNATLSWENNGKTFIRSSSYSLPGQPDSKDYQSIEKWTLSADHNELIILRQYTYSNGQLLSITAVYDRQ